jgi:hypothetical protein
VTVLPFITLAQNASSSSTGPACARMPAAVESEQGQWLADIDLAAERQRLAVEAEHESAIGTLKDEVMCQVRKMPFAEKTIWMEYFSMVRGAAWSQLNLDTTAGNNLVRIPGWKVRRQLLNDAADRQMVDIILAPDTQELLLSLLNGNPSDRNVQIRASALYEFVKQCQFRMQCIENDRRAGLLAVSSHKKQSMEEARSLITYRSHRPTEQGGLNVIAISMGRDGATAMVNDMLVKVGDTVGQAKVARIGRYDIEFDTGGQRSVVKLADALP